VRQMVRSRAPDAGRTVAEGTPSTAHGTAGEALARVTGAVAVPCRAEGGRKVIADGTAAGYNLLLDPGRQGRGPRSMRGGVGRCSP